MAKADIAVLLALCAALASAFGDVIRQRSAHEITEKHVGHLELFRMSLRDPRWWLGGGNRQRQSLGIDASPVLHGCAWAIAGS